MKEQMVRYYNEQAYTDASQQTKDHRQLHQTDSSMRKLMSMLREVQRSIWKLNMRYILTSDNRTTTEIIIIYIYIAQYPANTACSTRL